MRATDPTLRYERRYEPLMPFARISWRSNQRTRCFRRSTRRVAATALCSWAPLAGTGQSSTATDCQTGSDHQTHAIAVLPFKNLSAGAGNEQFADGLTYEIHRYLAGIQGLELRSATSSFAFKASDGGLRYPRTTWVGLRSRRIDSRSPATRYACIPRLARVADDTTVWAGIVRSRVPAIVFATSDDISLESSTRCG